jgi:tripartite-type tricarboxylate transporter receptor subunit TctC
VPLGDDEHRLALARSLTACGGNVGGGSAAGADSGEFPGGEPISLYVGQDPGGSTDLIARALAEEVSDDLGVAVTVENKPGANGALAAQELASEEADGHTLMVYHGSLAYITPLAVAEGEAPDIANYDIVTGISLDDYVLVTAPDAGFTTVDDLAKAGRPIKFGTTGVGTGSQRSQELLFAQADIDATAIPFDGGSPTLTAVLGGQVDVGSIQLGEAIELIEAGELTPIVTFAAERPTLPARRPHRGRGRLRRAGAAVPGRLRSRGHAGRRDPHAARVVPEGLRVRGVPAVPRGQPADSLRGRRGGGPRGVDRQPGGVPGGGRGVRHPAGRSAVTSSPDGDTSSRRLGGSTGAGAATAVEAHPAPRAVDPSDGELLDGSAPATLHGAGSARTPASGTWPLLISIAIVVLGPALVVTGRTTSDAERFSRSSWLVLAGLATMVFFLAAIETIGFEIPAALLAFVWLRFLGRESWRSSIVTSLGVVITFYVIFVAALSVPIPHLF